SNLKLNDGHPIPPPPRPPPQATAAALAATTALAQRNRTRAINIDRFSRVFFPLLFAVLNMTYIKPENLYANQSFKSKVIDIRRGIKIKSMMFENRNNINLTVIQMRSP
ncbi:glycine receptor subunit alpha-2-like isoform X2, partial [Aphis craccivora]